MSNTFNKKWKFKEKNRNKKVQNGILLVCLTFYMMKYKPQIHDLYTEFFFVHSFILICVNISKIISCNFFNLSNYFLMGYKS